MKSVLVVYGTTQGQTRKIAEFIAEALNAGGVKAELVDSADRRASLVQPTYAAAIVCGSLHQHRCPKSLQRFVKDNAPWLAGIPCAFVAVGPTAVLEDEHGRAELRKAAEAFCRETGWAPAITRHVAGCDDLQRFVGEFLAATTLREGGHQPAGQARAGTAR